MPKAATVKAPLERADAALLDTYSLVFRAFHALPLMTTSRGVPTSALYGFCTVVLKILREQRPRALSFALDAPARTFRRERYDDYKAGRARAPSELAAQLERLPELLEAFGVPAFCAPGFEADDLLATLALRLTNDGKNVLIVSGDRDLLQLVSAHARVWFVGARGQSATLFDLPAVEARFGLSPEKLPSFTALVGDASDNLEGAPGIGPRTASKLVLEYGSVAELLANLERVPSTKIRDTLRGSAERLLMNEELARLRSDVPLGDGPLTLPITASTIASLRSIFDELEFKSLIPRLESLSRDIDETA